MLPERVRSIFLTSVRLYGHSGAKKGHKLGSKGDPKQKIDYYEAKYAFKVPKMHSSVLKLVCYLKESTRGIFLTSVRL